MPNPFARQVQLDAWACRCARCGHHWTAMAYPVSCAGCKSRSWDKAPGSVPLGRRKQPK